MRTPTHAHGSRQILTGGLAIITSQLYLSTNGEPAQQVISESGSSVHDVCTLGEHTVRHSERGLADAIPILGHRVQGGLQQLFEPRPLVLHTRGATWSTPGTPG